MEQAMAALNALEDALQEASGLCATEEKRAATLTQQIDFLSEKLRDEQTADARFQVAQVRLSCEGCSTMKARLGDHYD
ncbi:Cct domain [Globisporangium polare]